MGKKWRRKWEDARLAPQAVLSVLHSPPEVLSCPLPGGNEETGGATDDEAGGAAHHGETPDSFGTRANATLKSSRRLDLVVDAPP